MRKTLHSVQTLSPREGKGVVGNLTLSAIIATRRVISRLTVGQKAVVKQGKGKSQTKRGQDSIANADSDDAAWMVDLEGGADIILDDIFDDLFKDEIVTVDNDIPELLTCSSSENHASDTDSSDDKNLPCKWIHARAKRLLVEDNKGEAYTHYQSAMLTHDDEHEVSNEIELYDSGASHHMSPYRNCFINFISIVSKAITTAGKLAFDATGCGDMEIEVLFGNGRSSKILLKDMLYVKDMGVTLVSISCITATGHKAIFDGPFLKIFNSTRKLLGGYQSVKGSTMLSRPSLLTLQWKL
jgi:hypothetical protein